MSKKILVIDDSREILELHKQFLKNKYEVICCESGLGALEEISKSTPDLILLDIEMPYMDGLTLLEKIRKKKECYNVPVIGITGDKSKSTILKFMSCGGNSYLVKPVEKDTLLSNVEEQLNQFEIHEKKKTILIVDDEIESLRVMQNFLKDEFNVTVLNSGSMVLTYLKQFTPDLILLDYEMAPFNGASVLNMIRKIDDVKDVPVIFVTGTASNENLLECAGMKPSGILLKPVNKNSLLEKVRRTLNGEDAQGA